ncbi:MAG: GNAT family N-acetyltransferase [Verrucomicrobia bacterium]|nr:GNAT family N-acetyltransferase [Verrucomicrobiota bacterium]
MYQENNIFVFEDEEEAYPISTRPAKAGEEGLIYEMALALARSEGEVLNTLPVTKENLHRFGFCENPLFHTEFVEYQNKVVGYALYFYTFSSSQGYPILYIEDLYVKPEYRSMGMGKELFKKLATYAIQKNCCRLEWHVYSWNTSAAKFYQKLGSSSRRDLIQTRLEKKDLFKLF